MTVGVAGWTVWCREIIEYHQHKNGSCRAVQEDQNTDVARICSDEEVIGDFEARLKGFIELMAGHELLELGGNCSFQDFA